MWNIMVLLYPELWEKFGNKSPTATELRDHGYAKDKTSILYIRWMEALDICGQSEGDINSDKNLGDLKKLGDCRHDFFNSIKDKRFRYILELSF